MLGPALPSSTTDDDDPSASRPIPPQSAYHTRLTTLFLRHRAALRIAPPAAAIAALSPQQLISCPASSRAAFAEWRHAIRTLDPSPVQLAAMDGDTALRVLRLAKMALGRGRRVDGRLSAWVWGLLARLPEVGTMGSEEVSVVREVGKRAVWAGNRVWGRGEAERVRGFAGEEDEEDEHEESGGEDGNVAGDAAGPPQSADTSATLDASVDSLEEAKARLLAKVSDTNPLDAADARPPGHGLSDKSLPLPPQPDENTRATLDMIVTMVGEHYGQRDLLRYRSEWDDSGSR